MATLTNTKCETANWVIDEYDYGFYILILNNTQITFTGVLSTICYVETESSVTNIVLDEVSGAVNDCGSLQIEEENSNTGSKLNVVLSGNIQVYGFGDLSSFGETNITGTGNLTLSNGTAGVLVADQITTGTNVTITLPSGRNSTISADQIINNGQIIMQDVNKSKVKANTSFAGNYPKGVGIFTISGTPTSISPLEPPSDYAPEFFEIQPDANNSNIKITNKWTSPVKIYVGTAFVETLAANTTQSTAMNVNTTDIIRVEESQPNVTFRGWNTSVKEFVTSNSTVHIISMPKMDAFTIDEAGTKAGDNFFWVFDGEWSGGSGGHIIEFPVGSFDTSKITEVGNSFFYAFTGNGTGINILPVGSFNISNIQEVGDDFFAYFNCSGKLNSLPDGSFNTGNIEKVGNGFFESFNSGRDTVLAELPIGSFDTSKITEAGNSFFANFNAYGSLTQLPVGSFNTEHISTIGTDFFRNFNGSSGKLTKQEGGIAIKVPANYGSFTQDFSYWDGTQTQTETINKGFAFDGYAEPEAVTPPNPPAPPAPPATTITKIPVYRAAKYQGGYFYTSDVAEYNTVGQYGMRPEGLAFYITDINTLGAVAVYRAAKLNGSGYFYTTDLAEYGTVSQYNMRPEGFAFYVMPASSNLYGEIPVYRGAHLVNEGYIYTSDRNEYDSALPANGYRKENEVFRVFAG